MFSPDRATGGLVGTGCREHGSGAGSEFAANDACGDFLLPANRKRGTSAGIDFPCTEQDNREPNISISFLGSFLTNLNKHTDAPKFSHFNPF